MFKSQFKANMLLTYYKFILLLRPIKTQVSLLLV